MSVTVDKKLCPPIQTTIMFSIQIDPTPLYLLAGDLGALLDLADLLLQADAERAGAGEVGHSLVLQYGEEAFEVAHKAQRLLRRGLAGQAVAAAARAAEDAQAAGAGAGGHTMSVSMAFAGLE